MSTKTLRLASALFIILLSILLSSKQSNQIPNTAITLLSFIIIFLLTFKPIIYPFLQSLQYGPKITKIPIFKTQHDLNNSIDLTNKHVLVIGGTRGVGFGTALSMAKAGAFVTIVGRSEASGTKACNEIQKYIPSSTNESRIDYVKGDIGTVSKAKELLKAIAEHGKKYDYLIMSAAIFPSWEWESKLNEDGIDKCFAIAVVGRYLIYHQMHTFLNENARVLNVLTAGMKPMLPFNRELVLGKFEYSNLLQNIACFSLGNDIMMLQLHQHTTATKYTIVNTHPGLLKTDLHRGQGFFFDLFEAAMVSLVGESEYECGLKQVSILTSDKLKQKEMTFADEFGITHKLHDSFMKEAKLHKEWLWDLLVSLEKKT